VGGGGGSCNKVSLIFSKQDNIYDVKLELFLYSIFFMHSDLSAVH